MIGISKATYRNEIDGLRAFAVIAVLLHHFNRTALPSGYLGVDIFFVISGFVITASLAHRPAKSMGEFVLDFYARRVKRLIPALLLCVVITSILICLFNPTPIVSLKTGGLALLGLSNLYLLHQGIDYWGESAEINAFTQTWSLGVEEQFYLLFPLIFWCCGFVRSTRKGSHRLFWLLCALSALSLVAFVYVSNVSQPFAYFLMPTRFWEIGAGAILFLGRDMRLPLLERLPLPQQNLLLFALFAAAIAVLFLPVQASLWATVAVVTLTMLLIAALHPQTTLYTLLTAPWVRYIGQISYSLYLWHWSVLTISRWTVGIHWWTVPIQMGLILLLAIGSYHFLEQPLRHTQWHTRRWVTVAYGATSALIALLFVLLLIRFNPLFLGERHAEKYPELQAYAEPPQQPAKGCNIFTEPEDALVLGARCGIGDIQMDKTIYLLGDSHAMQFGTMIENFAEQHRYATRFIWGNDCKFPGFFLQAKTHVVVRGLERECLERMQIVEQQVLDSIKSGDVVVIGNLLLNIPQLTEGLSTPAGVKIDGAQAIQLFRDALYTFTDQVNHKGGKVVFFHDRFVFPRLRAGHNCNPQWFNFYGLPSECFLSRSASLLEREKFFGWLQQWANGRDRILWDAGEEFSCEGDWCAAVHYRNSTHLENDYKGYIFAKLVKEHPNLF